jgi:hypothetical protein
MSLQHAHALVKRGLPVFRLRRGTKDHFVDTAWARGGATKDPIEIYDRFNGGQYNIGVLSTNHLVLDVDCKTVKGKTRNGFPELAALEAEHGKLPTTYVQRTPSGGLHYFFDACGEAYGQRDLSPGINVRATNGYVLGAGSSFDDKPYTVEVDAPIAPLPEWLRRLLFDAPTKDLNAGKVQGELDTDAAIAATVSYLTGSAELSIEGQGGDLNAYKVACQCLDRGLSPATCLSLMLEHWNDRCSPPWDEDELQKKVDSAIVNRQKAIGSDNPTEGFTVIDFPKPDIKKSRTIWPDEQPVFDNYEWMLRDTIPRRGIGFIAGASGSGKTFALIDLAAHLWRGVDWFGRKVDYKCGTYIVAAESAYSVKPRLSAVNRFKFGAGPADALHGPVVYCKDVPNFLSEHGVSEFIEDLRVADARMRSKYGVPLGLVGIDTFGQGFRVKDENGAPDTTEATRVMQAISDALDIVVCSTHHFGHNGRLRGSTALRANADFVKEIRNGGELVLEKCRDAKEGTMGFLKLETVTIGTRPDDGSEVTSCVLRETVTTGSSKKKKGPKPLDAAFLASFTACASTQDGVRRADKSVLRARMMECWAHANPKTQRANLSKALKSATAEGYTVTDEWVISP